MNIEQIKSTRREKGLSLRDVSDKTGISIATLSRIENGSNVSYKTVAKLTEFLKEQEKPTK